MDTSEALVLTIVIGTCVLLSCVLISVAILMAVVAEWEWRNKAKDKDHHDEQPENPRI